MKLLLLQGFNLSAEKKSKRISNEMSQDLNVTDCLKPRKCLETFYRSLLTLPPYHTILQF